MSAKANLELAHRAWEAVSHGDVESLQEIWDENPLLQQYLQTIDNPQFILYQIVPRRVRYMREWALEYYDVPVD